MLQQKSGQVILVVLLASAVILTVGLAVASQTVTDVNISSQEQEYTRSFNAAEAGIEDLLNQEDGIAGLPDSVSCNNSNNTCEETVGSSIYRYYYEEVGATGYEVVDPVVNGGVFQLNMESFGANGGTSMNVYWASSSVDNGRVPLELTFYYANNTVYRLAIVPPSSGTDMCGSPNDFSYSGVVSDSGSFDLREYDWRYTVSGGNIFNNLSFVRVRPLCSVNTYLAFSPEGVNFPDQAVVAHVESQSGDNTAAIETEQVAHKFLPGIFDFSVFSGTGIVVNN